MQRITLRHPSDYTKVRVLEQSDLCEIEPLLVEAFKDGHVVNDHATIEEMRARRKADIDRLDAGVKRLVNPHIYHVSLTDKLWNLKQNLIDSAMERSR
jgi:nicotinate phosphoribosyltransferase